MTAAVLDPSNAEQDAAWDGDEGRYWAEHAAEFDRSVRLHHDRLMAVAAIGRRDRVLDVGCGNGETACDAGRAAPDGAVLGVDLSQAMLTVARQRADAAGLGHVEFLAADAQVHPFEPGGFDVVVGRCSAMFFGDQPAALANVARALRPGGRLALVTWQTMPRNRWFVEFGAAFAAGRALPGPPPGSPNPFSLADPDRVRELLEGAGFVDVGLESSEGPMRFGDDVGQAYEFVMGMLGWMLRDLDPAGRRRAERDLRESLDRHASAAGVNYDSAAWIVTARTSGE